MKPVYISGRSEPVYMPDSMSDEEIKAAIEKRFPPKLAKPPQEQPGAFQRYVSDPLKAAGESLAGATQPVREAELGFAQGLANIPAGIANLGVSGINALTGGKIPQVPRFSFAPQTGAAEVGNLASFLAGPGLLKGAAAVPRVAEAIGPLANIFSKAPLASEVAGQAALGGAYSPEHQAAGAALGALGPIAGRVIGALTGAQGQFAQAAGRTALGAGAGATAAPVFGVSPMKGAEVGGVAGLSLPYASKLIPRMGGKPGLNILKTLRESEARPAVEAGQRIGDVPTPSEASGDPYIGAKEGRLSRTGEASAKKTRFDIDRIAKQDKIIGSLLNKIYDKSSKKASLASAQKVADLYEASFKESVTPEEVAKFKEDPIVAKAFARVLKKDAWQRRLKGVPETNYRFLNTVKKSISDTEGSLIRRNRTDEATEYGNARREFVDVLDKQSDSYKIARQEAKKGIVRNQMQQRMDKGEITGRNFYKEFLGNKNKFDDLIEDLRDVPEAQDTLRDMRLAWKEVMNLQGPGAAAFRQESGVAQARQKFSKLMDMYNDLTGGQTNVEALEFIRSPDWIDSMKKISNVKGQKQRARLTADLLGRLGSGSIIQFLNPPAEDRSSQ